MSELQTKYEAKGRHIRKLPIKNGTNYSLGFEVCVVSEFLDPGQVVEMLNYAERESLFEEQCNELRKQVKTLWQIAAGLADCIDDDGFILSPGRALIDRARRAVNWAGDECASDFRRAGGEISE